MEKVMAGMNKVSIVAALRVFYNQELKALMDKRAVKWADAWYLYAFDRRFRAVPLGHLTHGGMDVLQFVPKGGLTAETPEDQRIRLLINYQTPVEGAVCLHVLLGADTDVKRAVRVATAPTRVLPGPQRQKAFSVLPLVRWMVHFATAHV